jgi:hypothetical protein
VPALTGHVTDRPNKFNVTERELAKRKILHAAIAEELSRPLISVEHLNAARRSAIWRNARYQLSLRRRAWPLYAERDIFPAHRARSLLPPGVSSEYEAGTPAKPTKVIPRWERRIVKGWPMNSRNQVSEFLGAAAFAQWRSKGIGQLFAGKQAGDMDRDELLAAFAYAMHGFHVWRESGLRRDKKYRGGLASTAVSVTEAVKDKPLPANWLGANKRMVAVIGNATDRREAL